MSTGGIFYTAENQQQPYFQMRVTGNECDMCHSTLGGQFRLKKRGPFIHFCI